MMRVVDLQVLRQQQLHGSRSLSGSPSRHCFHRVHCVTRELSEQRWGPCGSHHTPSPSLLPRKSTVAGSWAVAAVTQCPPLCPLSSSLSLTLDTALALPLDVDLENSQLWNGFQSCWAIRLRLELVPVTWLRLELVPVICKAWTCPCV